MILALQIYLGSALFITLFMMVISWVYDRSMPRWYALLTWLGSCILCGVLWPVWLVLLFASAEDDKYDTP